MDKYVIKNLKNLKPNYDAGISGGSSSKFDLNDSGSLSDCCSKNKKLKSNHGAAVAGPSTPSSSSSHSMCKSTLFVVTETDSEAEAELQNVSLEVEVEDNGSIFDKSGNEEDHTEDMVESVQPVVQKKNLNIYKHKFQEKWLQIYPWLRFDNNKLLCYPCNKHLGFKIYDIKRHVEAASHKKNCSKLRNTPKITNVLESEAVLKKHQQVKRAELKICAFLHEHNLPFLLADHLPKFIRSICPDSDIAKNINCSRTKATYLTNECINLEQLEYLSNILKKSKFSLLIDETTDISTEKSLAMVIRFYDDYNKKINRTNPGTQCQGQCHDFYHLKCAKLPSGFTDLPADCGIAWYCKQCKSDVGKMSPVLNELVQKIDLIRSDTVALKSQQADVFKSLTFYGEKIDDFNAKMEEFKSVINQVETLKREVSTMKEECSLLKGELETADALYNQICSVSFGKGDSIPKKHQHDIPNEQTKLAGRPSDKNKEDLLEICRWLKENDEPISVQDLLDKIAELLPENIEPYTLFVVCMKN
ncbi:unnamed protein product [Phaedon cochleariae]|uniref:Uncharacterized protein n=1 Tax=Phaedon cochleariae TaxID=80249 RepID=A0A9N9SBL7_PHACE|nr:unnamed protein product [Phaedon cochleariae]